MKIAIEEEDIGQYINEKEIGVLIGEDIQEDLSQVSVGIEAIV